MLRDGHGIEFCGDRNSDVHPILGIVRSSVSVTGLSPNHIIPRESKFNKDTIQSKTLVFLGKEHVELHVHLKSKYFR